jgi:hypothetical protein
MRTGMMLAAVSVLLQSSFLQFEADGHKECIIRQLKFTA